jgi:CubicO group peptidase (beta-lactamase class C family)
MPARVVTCVLSLLLAPIHAGELKTDSPVSVGMSERGLNSAAQLLEAEVRKGGITAASIAVVRHDTIVLSRGYGKLWPEVGSDAVEPDSIFLLASITKPVTALALMRLVDRGLVSLDDPVAHYIPEFTAGERGKILVRHILSHISGLPSMPPENTELRRANAPLSRFVERTIVAPLIFSPGTQYRYQSAGLLLAGEIVERLTGMRLREYLQGDVFAPLGMSRSALGMGNFVLKKTAWVKDSPNANPHDLKRFGANTPYWRDQGHPWGGMHSSAMDLALLMRMMLNGGKYSGKRILSRAAIDAMTRDQNRGLHAPYGLGWALAKSPGASRFGELVSDATFGHTGATGTVAWADPERDLICVILTNHKVDSGRLLRLVSNRVVASVVE